MGSLPRPFAATVVLAIGACAGQVPEAGVPPPTVTGTVGQQVTIDLRTIGGGPAWDSVPAVTSLPLVSSAAVRFVSMTYPPPYSPGGPNQRFTFEALTPGYATVTFSRGGTVGGKTYVIQVQ